jgi:hypothetical protein
VSGAGISTLDRLRVNEAFRSGPSFGIETGYMTQSNLEPFVRPELLEARRPQHVDRQHRLD